MKRALLLLLCCIAVPAVCAQSPAAKTYTPGAFESIEITGSAAVHFTQGAVDQVVVEGDDETRQSITVEVQGGRLSIRSSGAWKFWSSRQLQIAVTARTLRRVTISGSGHFHAHQTMQVDQVSIEISGSGSVHLDQLKAESLRLGISGAGHGEFGGTVRELHVSISGKGRFEGERLAREDAHVSISGAGDAQVWATRELGIVVAGVGKVDYWGGPRVRRKVSGGADVNHRGDESAEVTR